MKRTTDLRVSLVLAALALVAFSAASAQAQFQSCVYCDVMPFDPDPFVVRPCETGTIIISGAGYQDRLQNGCDAVPFAAVRSTRPDRLTIVSWQVLADNSIQFSYDVPCNAPPGLVGIDVTIDDIAGDAIEPYACGNARMVVDNVLAVTWDSYAVRATDAGNEISWRTLSEHDTAVFQVWALDLDGQVEKVGTVRPHGAYLDYTFLDTRGVRVAGYKLVERTIDGLSGDTTDWFYPELGDAAPSRSTGRSRTSSRQR